MGAGFALVKKLEVARVDGTGFVIAGADEVAVANIVGPTGAGGVGFSGKRLVLRSGLGSPLSVESGCRVGTEVTLTPRANRLDDHEIHGSALALDGVDLDGFEEVVLGAVKDDRGLVPEAAGEVANGHARAVDAAVVSGEEEVHVGAVADERLVDGARVGVGDAAGPERLRRRPAVLVNRVS